MVAPTPVLFCCAWGDRLLCPFSVDGVWGQWAPSGGCSENCGGGKQKFTRTCQDQQCDGDPCAGDDEKEESCNTDPCPITCAYNGDVYQENETVTEHHDNGPCKTWYE